MKPWTSLPIAMTSSPVFDFDELGFGITVKLTSLLDVFNQPCGQQAQADRVNF